MRYDCDTIRDENRKSMPTISNGFKFICEIDVKA